MDLLAEIQGEIMGGYSHQYDAGRIIGSISSKVAAMSKRVRVVSKEIGKQVMAAGVSPDKVKVIPNRVDTNLFRPSNKSAKRDRFVFMFAGSLVRIKGVEYLIRAFHILSKDWTSIALWIVGDGPDRKRLMKISEKLGVSSTTKFWGRISHNRVAELMQQADVFVLPSLTEGMPRVLLEAMATRLPVVATDVGGIREIVENGKSGLVVSPSEVVELAQAMEMLLTRNDFANQLSSHAYDRVIRKHHWKKGIREIAKFLSGNRSLAPE
jgi:glycosyltransferase involved in cell wall biosynthesis